MYCDDADKGIVYTLEYIRIYIYIYIYIHYGVLDVYYNTL